MRELTRDDFEAVVGEGSVVVDFWAPWCAPCKMFAPIYEEAAKGHKGITFAKLNTEDHPEVAQQAGIRGIPTTVFFKDGKEVHRQVGAMMKPQFEALLTKVFG